MIYLLFFLGLMGLWLGAEAVIRGASGIAVRIGLSESFVGMTVLALGTGLPELTISITGAIEQIQGTPTTGLIIGNIVGSNIGNLAFILGLAGILKVIDVSKKELVANGSAMIASSLAFYVFAQDGVISRMEGLILLIGFGFYLLLLLNKEKKSLKSVRALNKKRKRKTKIAKKLAALPMWWLLVQLLVGSVIIFEASQLVLQNGLLLAEILKIPPLIVGIILLGIGTSLPELVVSVSALVKGSVGLSVGNLLGSNVMNILLALGGSALITQWQIPSSIVQFDLPLMMIVSIVILLFLLTRQKLERKESFLILALYYGYIMLKLQGF